MHPDPHFRWKDEAAVRDWVEQRGLAAIFVPGEGGPRVVHTPVTWHGEALRFHFSNRNIAMGEVDGRTALTVVSGPDHYISPGWYDAGPDAVPTWNYVAVEIEGPVRAMGREALTGQIDRLVEVHEGKLPEGRRWTRAKADPAKIEKMLNEITAYEQTVTAIRTTAKMNQNKPEAQRQRAAAALRTYGADAVADWMEGV